MTGSRLGRIGVLVATLGLLGAAAGLIAESAGWWSPQPFEVNVASSLVGALVGIPIAVFLLSRVQAELSAEVARAEYRSRLSASVATLGLELARYCPKEAKGISVPLRSPAGVIWPPPADMAVAEHLATNADALQTTTQDFGVLISAFPDLGDSRIGGGTRLGRVALAWERLRDHLALDPALPQAGPGWSVRAVDDTLRAGHTAVAWLGANRREVEAVRSAADEAALFWRARSRQRDDKERSLNSPFTWLREPEDDDLDDQRLAEHEKRAHRQLAKVLAGHPQFEQFWRAGALTSAEASGHINAMVTAHTTARRAAQELSSLARTASGTRPADPGLRIASGRYRTAAMVGLVSGVILLLLGLYLQNGDVWDTHPFALNTLSSVMAASFGLATAVVILPPTQALLASERRRRETREAFSKACADLRASTSAWTRAGHPVEDVLHLMRQPLPDDEREPAAQRDVVEDLSARPAAVETDRAVAQELVRHLPVVTAPEGMDALKHQWARFLALRSSLGSQGTHTVSDAQVDKAAAGLANAERALAWVTTVLPLIHRVHDTVRLASTAGTGGQDMASGAHLDGAGISDLRDSTNHQFEQYWREGGMRGPTATKHVEALFALPALVQGSVPDPARLATRWRTGSRSRR